jgi:UrcA family protein
MISKTFTTGAVAASMLMVLSIATPAMAQGQTRSMDESQTKSTELGAITVVAPRIAYKEVRRVRGSVIPKEITLIKKTVQVSYADLDLRRTSDLYTLEDRVGKAAAGVCQDLAHEVPDGEPDTAICERRAIKDAMAQLRLDHPTVAFRP